MRSTGGLKDWEVECYVGWGKAFFDNVNNLMTNSLAGAFFQFPLVARSGKIRRLVACERPDAEGVMHLQLPDLPGGSEAFDLAAKFCYGINYDITTFNVALLRCAADYLEMNEQWGDNNLVERTEKFLNEFVLQNLAESIAVLHNCESLLPLAEDLKLVNRCINAAAAKAIRYVKSLLPAF